MSVVSLREISIVLIERFRAGYYVVSVEDEARDRIIIVPLDDYPSALTAADHLKRDYAPAVIRDLTVAA